MLKVITQWDFEITQKFYYNFDQRDRNENQLFVFKIFPMNSYELLEKFFKKVKS